VLRGGLITLFAQLTFPAIKQYKSMQGLKKEFIRGYDSFFIFRKIIGILPQRTEMTQISKNGAYLPRAGH
jgi:hypothetical protein